MAKNERIVSLDEIIECIDSRSGATWYEIMGVHPEGLAEAYANGEQDDFASAMQLEWAYIREHGGDNYLVTWPDHVSNPRFNSDASYQLLESEVAK